MHLGRQGIYGLAVLTGLAPVDPFIMGLTQTAGKMTSLGLAAGGVVVAAASNNFAKAFIALVLADPKTGRQSLFLLLGSDRAGPVATAVDRAVGARSGYVRKPHRLARPPHKSVFAWLAR